MDLWCTVQSVHPHLQSRKLPEQALQMLLQSSQVFPRDLDRQTDRQTDRRTDSSITRNVAECRLSSTGFPDTQLHKTIRLFYKTILRHYYATRFRLFSRGMILVDPPESWGSWSMFLVHYIKMVIKTILKKNFRGATSVGVDVGGDYATMRRIGAMAPLSHHNIVSGCSEVAKTESIQRHNIKQQPTYTGKSADNIRSRQLTSGTNSSPTHEITILWDMPIQTDREIKANRPDIVIKNTTTKEWRPPHRYSHIIRTEHLCQSNWKNCRNTKTWR